LNLEPIENENMTKIEFADLCEMHCIEPYIALENERIVAALLDRKSQDEIEEILCEEF
jgi:hypothetical protein